MGLRSYSRSGTSAIIDFGSGPETVDVGTITVAGTRTIAKVEAAVNAWLAARVDNGQFMQVHIWALSPLDFSMRSSTNVPLPAQWWLDI